MVDAIVSMVLDQLASFAREEIRMLVGVTDKVTELTDTLTTIQKVLRDADEKQIQDKGLLKIWVNHLKEVSYQIEDVLDRWNTKLLKSKIKTGFANNKVSSNFFNLRNRHKFGREIKGIREKLQDIARSKNDFNLITGTVVTELPERETSSVVKLSEVYGRDGDRDTISSKLLGESGREKMGVDVIAIVALGGLGKTTLAQKISHEVKHHFKKNAWVCVSKPFNREKIAKAIIEAFGGNVPINCTWNTLHNLLTDTVKDKLFMLVLDDVWTENSKDWEPFKLSLEGGAPRSRILVTTRNEAVATMMESSYSHHLKGLDEDNSWLVFCLAALLKENDKNYEVLKPFGKEIAKKCKDVPLYLKTMGAVMSKTKDEVAWENAMRSEIWKTEELEIGVLPALLLSYYDLPSQVKPCFTYCAIYPEDYKMNKETLIHLWMAQGFLYSDRREALEKVGEGYFDTLVRRSLFQDLEYDKMGNVTHCRMHDLVHDLVQFLTKNEIQAVDDMSVVKTSNKLRHFTSWKAADSYSTICNAKDLRTLFLQYTEHRGNLDSSFWLHLKCLRTLVFSEKHLEHLPNKIGKQIGKLIHLRYLDLSESSIKKLPKSLCDLCNLQTLILSSCEKLGELPASMGKMIGLRHLDLSKTSITEFSESVCDLCNLQTLILSSCKKLGELPASMGKMIGLRHLDLRRTIITELPKSVCDLSKLQTLNLESCRELSELPASMGNMISLRHLDLSMIEFCNLRMTITELPESVCDLSNLRTLKLESCELGELPARMGEMISLRDLDLTRTSITKLPESVCNLFNLQTLYLFSCSKLGELPASMGKMISLRDLDLSYTSITELPESVCDLSNLQTLKLKHCKLGELPASMGKMISLRDLNLVGTSITELPESVCDLYNLQTLDLCVCEEFGELPASMGKMINLRHLDLTYTLTDKPRCLPRVILELISLQDLHLDWLDVSGANGSCSLGELKHLNILSDTLQISGLWGVDLASEAKRPFLAKYYISETLCLDFKLPEGSQWLEDDTERMEGVMECLQPHPNLWRLQIWGYIGSKLPSWMSSDLMSTWELCRLEISDAPNLKTLPAFGKLKSLEVLKLWHLDSLERIGAHFWGISDDDTNQGVSGEPLTVFPKLKVLKFMGMNMLEEWETKKESWREDVTFIMPCLEKLIFKGCKKLKPLPHNIFSYHKVEEKIHDCPQLNQGATTNQVIGKLHDNSQTSR